MITNKIDYKKWVDDNKNTKAKIKAETVSHFIIDCSKCIVTESKATFPKFPVISMNIRGFRKAIYCNKEMV